MLAGAVGGPAGCRPCPHVAGRCGRGDDEDEDDDDGDDGDDDENDDNGDVVDGRIVAMIRRARAVVAAPTRSRGLLMNTNIC